MPQYVVFMMTPRRPNATGDNNNNNNNNEVPDDDPFFQKMMRAFLGWVTAEAEAGRFKGGNSLVEYNDESSVRVNFHTPDMEAEAKLDSDGVLDIPAPNFSLARGDENYSSANIRCYYIVDFPALDEVVTWAQSCPVSYDGFSLEIRELNATEKALTDAPEDWKEWAGDHIIAKRKELMEQGKMRKDEDGTLWSKVEDEQWAKDVIMEAEKKQAERKEAEKGDSEKKEVEKEEVEQEEPEKKEVEKKEVEKEELEKKEPEKEESEKKEVEKKEPEKVEVEKEEPEKKDVDKEEPEKEAPEKKESDPIS